MTTMTGAAAPIAMNCSGAVEQVGSNGKSIKVGGEWYGAWEAANLSGCVVGDLVSFKYRVNKGYNNISGKVNVGATVATTGTHDQAPAQASATKVPREIAIIRQNALAHATKHTELMMGTQEIIWVELIEGWNEMNFKEQHQAIMEFTTNQTIMMAQRFEMYATGELDSFLNEELKKKLD
jgi:hypothetical protein